MKKILSILFTAYKNYNIYIYDIVWNNMIFILRIIVIITLYKYIYLNFSKDDLVSWYSIIQVGYAMIIAQVVSSSKPRVVDEISNDVKTWKIWVYFLNPINYIWFKFLEFFPIFMQNVIIGLCVWFVIGYLMLWTFPISLAWFFAWFLLLVWSMLIVFFSYTFIGIFAFFTEDVEAIRFLYSKFDMILWWNILPIPFLPWLLQTIAYLSPFAYFWYTSWLVFVSFDYYTFIKYFSIQMFWLIITIYWCIWLFSKASKKLTINWW